MIALGLYISAYQHVLIDIITEYNLPGWAGGFLVSLHFIASFLFPFFLGMLADRIGRKPVITGCFIMLLLGMTTVVIFGNVWLCGFGIFIIGGGFCVIESSMSSLLSETNPGSEIKVMNLSQMYFCLGAVIGPLLGMIFYNWFGNWRSVYIFIGLIFLICVILLIFQKLPKPIARADSLVKTVFKNKYFLILMLTMFIYVGIEEGAAFWAGEFINVTFGTATISAYFLSAYWLGMMLGRLIASYVKKHMKQLTLYGVLLALIFFSGMIIFKVEIPVVICFFMVGFGIAPIWPLIVALGTKANPEAPDTAVGVLYSAGASGAVVMPFFLGVCNDLLGMRQAFVIMLVLLGGLFAALMVVLRKRTYSKE